MSPLEIIFAIITGGLGIVISLLKYNFRETMDTVKKLRQDVDDFKDQHQESQVQLARLEERAVTREQMDEMFRDFETKLDVRIQSLNQVINERNDVILDKFKDLKEFLMKGKQ